MQWGILLKEWQPHLVVILGVTYSSVIINVKDTSTKEFNYNFYLIIVMCEKCNNNYY